MPIEPVNPESVCRYIWSVSEREKPATYRWYLIWYDNQRVYGKNAVSWIPGNRQGKNWTPGNRQGEKNWTPGKLDFAEGEFFFTVQIRTHRSYQREVLTRKYLSALRIQNSPGNVWHCEFKGIYQSALLDDS